MDGREIQVPEQRAGERLDRFVADALGLSRGYVRRLLHRGLIRLEGGAAVKGGLLRAGDRIGVSAFRHPEEGPLPDPSLHLPVVAESEAFVAFDKPAGMPSHPLDYEETATAVNAALASHPELARVGEGGLEAGLLHRLDTQTSGVLLFARTPAAFAEARAAFAAHRVDKRYLALVHGIPAQRGVIELRLAGAGSRVRVVPRGGHLTRTEIDSVEERGDRALVALRLVTGFRHQLRAVLAHLGHPIVGDTTYGSPDPSDRHYLHAVSLRLGDFEAHACLSGVTAG